MSSPLPTVPYEEQDMDKPLTDDEEEEIEVEEVDTFYELSQAGVSPN